MKIVSGIPYVVCEKYVLERFTIISVWIMSRESASIRFEESPHCQRIHHCMAI